MADQLSTMFYGPNTTKPLVLQTTFARNGFYALREWAWDYCQGLRAKWLREHRPFVGLNPTLERVTDGR